MELRLLGLLGLFVVHLQNKKEWSW